jgi:hypothetical protein
MKALAIALTILLAAPMERAAPKTAVERSTEIPVRGPVPAQPLSAEEEKELAQRDEEPGPEVAGGALSNLHLTYIVIALAAAVIVLILK